MIHIKKDLKSHSAFIIFFIVFVTVGLLIYKDYGISWDEEISRSECGIINYNFIKSGDYSPLIHGNEKYHGPAFEIFLAGIESIFDMDNTQTIYHMRHLITFLLFAISVLFFYRILFRYTRSPFEAVLGCLFVVLSPRIFADAFYNSKDLALLSFSIITIYTSINFLSSRSFISIFFHAIASAILIDIRILGIIIPIFTIIYSVLKISFEGNNNNLIRRNIIYIVLLIPFIILFWPVLWWHPFENFIAAFNEMRKYHWDGFVLFNGKKINALNLPWQYLPVWIGITTPILYLVLSIAGIALFLKNIFLSLKKNFQQLFTFDLEWLNLYIIIVPVTAVIVLNSVVYDGWRHLYFIYPSIIFFCIFALKFIFERLGKIKYLFLISVLIAGCSCIFTINEMIRLHPYQNIYFNSLAGNSYQSAKRSFELDYWGTSYLEGLKYIVANDKRNFIKISEDTYPGETNALMLDEKDRDRLIYTSLERADYFITTYRLHPEDYPNKELFSVTRGDAKLMSVFNMRPLDDLQNENSADMVSYNYNFNNPDKSWSGIEFASRDDSPEDKCSITNSGNNYSAVYNLNIDSAWSLSAKLRSLISFEMYSKDNLKIQVVVQADSSDGKMYYWKCSEHRYSKTGKWTKIKTFIDFPSIDQEDRVKIYLINSENKTFMIDNFALTIYEDK